MGQYGSQSKQTVERCRWFIACLPTEHKSGVLGFPGGSEVKNLPATVGDTGSIPDQAGTPHASE